MPADVQRAALSERDPENSFQGLGKQLAGTSLFILPERGLAASSASNRTSGLPSSKGLIIPYGSQALPAPSRWHC